MFLVELSDKKLFTAAADLTCSSEDSGCSAAPYQEPVNVSICSRSETERLPGFKPVPHGPGVQGLKAAC